MIGKGARHSRVKGAAQPDASLPCVIRDISYEGARIDLRESVDVPDEIDLHITKLLCFVIILDVLVINCSILNIAGSLPLEGTSSNAHAKRFDLRCRSSYW
jgi:hypothetical protein